RCRLSGARGGTGAAEEVDQTGRAVTGGVCRTARSAVLTAAITTAGAATLFGTVTTSVGTIVTAGRVIPTGLVTPTGLVIATTCIVAAGLVRSVLAVIVTGGRRIRGFLGGLLRRCFAGFLARLFRGLLGLLFRGLLGGLLGLFLPCTVVGGGRRRAVGVLRFGTGRELLHRQILHRLGHVLGPDVGGVTPAIDRIVLPEALHRQLLTILTDLVHRHRGGDLRDESAEARGFVVVRAPRLACCGAA